MEFSISKGCFLSKQKAKKGKSVLSKVSFCKLNGENDKDVQVRQKAFDHCWGTIEEIIEEGISQNRRRILELFEAFIHRTTQQLFNANPQTVPTAIVFEGCSISINDTLVCELKDNMAEYKDCPVVVHLKASDVAGTNMKSLMKTIMQQLITWEADNVSSIKLPDCSMSTLCSWYAEHIANERLTKQPAVCILIDGFESFPLNVFQDLVAMLSLRKDDFPAILVLGLQLPMNLHHLLSNSTLTKLTFTEFSTDSNEKIMKDILEKMLFDQAFPVKMSPDCCEVLLDNFKYTNLSVVSSLERLKSIVLDHFYWQPLSYLSVVKAHQLSQCMQKMSHCQCEMIRATPSFMSYIEQEDSGRAIKLLNDDTLLKTTVTQLLKRIEEYHMSVLPLIDSLCFFIIDMDGNNIMNNKIDIIDSLYHTETLSEVVDPLLEFFSFSSTVEFRKCLLNCVTYLKKYTRSLAKKQRLNWLSTLADDLQNYDSQLDSLLHKTSTVNFQAIKDAKKKITQYVNQFFCTHLLSIKTLPLHEVYYYTNITSLTKQVNVSPRQSIIRALNMPQYYLKNPVNCTTTDHVPLPYSSVAYQQYTTMGRVISLPEWMDACCVSESQSQLLQEQAGFLQSIAEMQFIGLYKSLPQKSNSVLKLYWDTTA